MVWYEKLRYWWVPVRDGFRSPRMLHQFAAMVPSYNFSFAEERLARSRDPNFWLRPAEWKKSACVNFHYSPQQPDGIRLGPLEGVASDDRTEASSGMNPPNFLQQPFVLLTCAA
jgi:hypothetical protein